MADVAVACGLVYGNASVDPTRAELLAIRNCRCSPRLDFNPLELRLCVPNRKGCPIHLVRLRAERRARKNGAQHPPVTLHAGEHNPKFAFAL
jgi:hypothetical protein